MNIKDIIAGKKEWKEHMNRVKALPSDYQIVYKEMQKYLYKVGPVELGENIDLLSGIVDLFEEGVSNGKEVLEVTGEDISGFCDELIKDSKTFYEEYLEKKSKSK